MTKTDEYDDREVNAALTSFFSIVYAGENVFSTKQKEWIALMTQDDAVSQDDAVYI